MEKTSEYRSMLFDINLIGNVCLNPWIEYPNRMFAHHMLNNLNDDQIKAFFFLFFQLLKLKNRHCINNIKKKYLFMIQLKLKHLE